MYSRFSVDVAIPNRYNYLDGSCFGPNFTDTRESMRAEAKRLLAEGGAFID